MTENDKQLSKIFKQDISEGLGINYRWFRIISLLCRNQKDLPLKQPLNRPLTKITHKNDYFFDCD